MVTHGETGVIVREAASVDALKNGILEFAREHRGSVGMRDRCRAAAVCDNDPAVIGAQLKELYQAALQRPMLDPERTIHRRMLKAFASTPVPSDAIPGRELLRFPVNLALLQRMRQPEVVERTVVDPPRTLSGKRRLLTVRTYHEHHSGSSGPYQFLRHLPDRQYETTHLAVPLGAELAGDMAPLYRKAGAMLGVRSFGQQANAWLAEAEVLLHCATEKISLVHFIDGELGGWLMPMFPAAVFRGGVRPALVATFHQPPGMLADMINAELVSTLSGVIALCESQQKFLQCHLDPKRIFLIPHGVDTRFFRPPPVNFVRPTSDAIRLLMVGHWMRDLDAALAALKLVAESGLKVEMTVISPRFPATRNDCRIILRSGLSDEALREAYWSADLLFLPLTDATANNAVLEAMACELAIVSTNVGGVKEAVGNQAGILCPPGDARMLASAVVRLACDPERRRAMGRAGRERAEALDWSVIGRMHDEAYSVLLADEFATPAAMAPVIPLHNAARRSARPRIETVRAVRPGPYRSPARRGV